MGKVLAMLIAMMPAVVAANTVLQPAGEWAFTQDAKACRALRTFGAGDEAHRVQLSSYGAGGGWELQVRGALMPRRKSRGVELHIDLGKGRVQDTYGVAGSAGGVPLLIALVEPPGRSNMFVRGWAENRYRISFDLDPTATTISLFGDDLKPLTLATGELAPVIRTLNGCQERLAESWGFTEPAPSKPATLLNHEAVTQVLYYPSTLLLNRVSTIVQVRAKVGTDGKATGCTVQSPNWGSDFERSTCNAIIGAARFEPARDAAGNPVESLFCASSMFMMKDD